MFLATFVVGLTGVPGTQVRYQKSPTLDKALKIALAMQEAEKQEKFGKSFYASFNNLVRLRSSSPTHHMRLPRGSEISAHAATKGQGPQEVGMHRRRLCLRVTSVKALVTLQGSVQHDYEKRPIL